MRGSVSRSNVLTAAAGLRHSRAPFKREVNLTNQKRRRAALAAAVQNRLEGRRSSHSQTVPIRFGLICGTICPNFCGE